MYVLLPETEKVELRMLLNLLKAYTGEYPL